MLNSPKPDSFFITAAIEAKTDVITDCSVSVTNKNEDIYCIPIYYINKQKRNLPHKKSPQQF
jgi:hypothetical protein